jgi:hypothetical protein
MPDFDISGLQEAQYWNQQELANLKPDGGFGQMLQQLTADMERYLISIVHVITGTYRAAQEIVPDLDNLRMTMQTAEGAENPVNHAMAADYGYDEEMRGGDHAAYQRTVDEALEDAFSNAAHLILDPVDQ